MNNQSIRRDLLQQQQQHHPRPFSLTLSTPKRSTALTRTDDKDLTHPPSGRVDEGLSQHLSGVGGEQRGPRVRDPVQLAYDGLLDARVVVPDRHHRRPARRIQDLPPVLRVQVRAPAAHDPRRLVADVRVQHAAFLGGVGGAVGVGFRAVGSVCCCCRCRCRCRCLCGAGCQ